MNNHANTLQPVALGIEKPDYKAAYAALARRVAAAYAYQVSRQPDESLKEMEAAMQVIEMVENPFAPIQPF